MGEEEEGAEGGSVINIETHKSTIDGLATFYKTAGDPKKPPLIFIDGWPMKFLNFKVTSSDQVITELAKYFYTVQPELAGLGPAEAPKEIWTFADRVKHLHKILQPLRLKSPIVMGQSFGGGVATYYANLYHNEVSVLILTDAITAYKQENFASTANEYGQKAYRSFLLSSFVPTQFKKWLINLINDVPYSYLAQYDLKNYANTVVYEKTHLLDKEAYDAIDFPVLLIWGDKDTNLTPVSAAKELNQKMKNSKLIVVSGDHEVLAKRPKEVVQKIIQNLNL